MIQAVVDHLWQSTLFAFGIALLCRLLGKDSARIRYWLWWAASVKLLVPFAVLELAAERLAADALAPYVLESWAAAADSVARPLRLGSEVSSTHWVLLAAWLAGSATVLLRWLDGTLRLRALLRRAEPDPRPVRCGRRWIGVYRTNEPIEPGVAGVLNPEILLPRDIDDYLTAEQLDAVLAHELCHVRRHDNLTAAVHRVAEAAFWYFPPVWWIGNRLVEERERACDEAVVALGHDPEIYAASVLDVCERFAALPAASVAGVSGGDLERRVTHIMRSTTMTHLGLAKKILLTAAAAVAIAFPVLVGMTVERTALAQNPEPYLPIVKVAPVYPPRAAARGLRGEVTVEFTITATGSTSAIEVVESTATLFDSATIEAVAKWKYAPTIENGLPVAVPGVRATIRYEPAASPDARGDADVVVSAGDD